MTAFKLALICILICGCSQHVKISPRKCIAPKANWSLTTDEDRFRYKHHIRMDGGNTYIRKIMDTKKMSCKHLDHVNITHKYTWKDVFWNMIPLTGRSTLIVGGSSSTSKPDEE